MESLHYPRMRILTQNQSNSILCYSKHPGNQNKPSTAPKAYSHMDSLIHLN